MPETYTPASMIEEMTSKNADLRALLTEHLEAFDELLPHVYFGDVERWAVAQPADSEPLGELIADLDRYWTEGDDATENVIAVSFIEPVGLTNRSMIQRLGPALRSTEMAKHFLA